MYTLDFDVRQQGLSDLEKIDRVIAGMKGSTQATSVQLEIFQKWMEQGVDRGRTFEQSLRAIVAAQGKADDATRNFARSLLAQAKAQQDAERADRDRIRALEEQERAYRRLAAAQDAANRENERRNQQAPGILDSLLGNNPGGGFLKGGVLSALGIGAFGGIGLQAGMAAGNLLKSILGTPEEVAQYAREMSNLASRTGLSYSEAQRWNQVAAVSGVNAGALTTAMRTLSRGLAEGEDEGRKQAAVLARLGVNAEDATGKLRPMGDVIQDIYRKLGDVPAGAQRDFFLQTLFGRGGLETAPLVGRLDEVRAELEQVAGVMNKDGIDAAVKYAHNIDVLEQRWESLKRAMATPVIGVLNLAFEGKSAGGPAANLINAILGSPDGATAPRMASSMFGQMGAMASAGAAAYGPDAVNSVLNQTRANQLAYDRLFATDPQEHLRQAQANLAAVPRPVRGQSTEADIEQYKSLEKAVQDAQKALSDSRKTDNSAQREKESLEQKVSDLEEKARTVGFGPVAQLYRERDLLVGAGGDWGRLTGATNILASQALGPLQDQAAKEAASRRNDESRENARSQDALERELEQNTHRFTDSFLKQVHTVQDTLKSEDSLQIGGIRDSAERSSRIAAISGRGSQNPLDIAAQQLQIRLQAIAQEQKVYEIHQGLYNIDLERAKLTKESIDAQLKFEEQIAEYEEKRKQSFVSGALGLLDAGIHGRAPSYLRQWGMGQLNTIAGNAAGAVWDHGLGAAMNRVGISDSGVLGGLLRGTALSRPSLKADPNTAATAANTTATASNTAAINALTSRIMAGASGIGGFPSSGAASTPWFNNMSAGPGDFTDAQGNIIPDVADYGNIPGASAPALSSIMGDSNAAGGMATVMGKGLQWAGVGLGAFKGISTIAKGGAQNITGGIGELAGAAAMIPGIGTMAAGILGVTALAGGVISAIMGDPRLNRQNQINKELGNATYHAPTALNETVNTAGMYTDYDQYGNLRSSPFVGKPMVTQPYSYYHNGTYIQYPGTVISPFQNPNLGIPQQSVANGQSPNNVPGAVIIQTFDSKSFDSWAMQPEHANSITRAVTSNVQNGNARNHVQVMAEQLGLR
jgi:hypothetical protein